MGDPRTPREGVLAFDAFSDCITQDVLIDPVVAADGYSYSRRSIEQWLSDHATSPMTNLRLEHRRLVPNHHLRWAIDEWREQQPLAFDADRLALSDELLGEGKFGVVYAGTLEVGRGRPPIRVAVKVLPALTHEQERESIESELKVYIHAAKQCDGICVLHGTCKKALPGAPGTKRLCIVMKRYERSLAAAIARAGGKLSIAAVRRYGQSIFRTLRQLHEAGVVVQDVKPENILLDAYDDPVIADFGISEIMRTQTRVMPTQAKGTFNYMSPEAFEPAEGAGVGPPADVWSMGCVVLEMFSGAQPWGTMQIQQIMMAVGVRKRAPDVPDGAPAAVMLRRCFASDPAQRPTAGEMAEALAPAEQDPAKLEDLEKQVTTPSSNLNSDSNPKLQDLEKQVMRPTRSLSTIHHPPPLRFLLIHILRAPAGGPVDEQ